METSGFSPANLENAPGSSDEPTDLEKTVRFAGFVLGGLVMLAIGVTLVSESLGQVLECVYQTEFCLSRDTGFYFLIVSPLGAGVGLAVIAAVLLLLGRNTR